MLKEISIAVAVLSVLLTATTIFAWTDGGITRGSGQYSGTKVMPGDAMGATQQIKQINIISVKGGQLNAAANTGRVTDIKGKLVTVRDANGATRTFEIDSASGLNVGDMVRWQNRADWTK